MEHPMTDVFQLSGRPRMPGVSTDHQQSCLPTGLREDIAGRPLHRIATDGDAFVTLGGPGDRPVKPLLSLTTMGVARLVVLPGVGRGALGTRANPRMHHRHTPVTPACLAEGVVQNLEECGAAPQPDHDPTLFVPPMPSDHPDGPS